MADANQLQVASAAAFNLRIGQRVHHREYEGRRVTGIVHGLSIDSERGLMVSILLDEPLVFPPRGADDSELRIYWQTAQAHEFQPFDERDELIAEMLQALEAMEHEFGRTYLTGSSNGVDLARAAIAKTTGGAP